MVLSEVRNNGIYHVRQLHDGAQIGVTNDKGECLGFVPGEQIVVVSRIGGNLIVNVKGSRVALSSELAKHITV